MKINIHYDFKDGPYGGGNQFLKALKNEFISDIFIKRTVILHKRSVKDSTFQGGI